MGVSSRAKVEVTFLPQDRKTLVPVGTTLFHAAHWIGLPIESTCGGRGTCGKCRIQVISAPPEPTPDDHRALTDPELAEGWRLACRARAEREAVCHVPALMRVPRAATMGVGRLVLLEPAVHKVRLDLPHPDLHDQRSDQERLLDALREAGYAARVDLPVLRELPGALRHADFRVTAVLVGEHVIAIEPGDTTDRSYGVAFDIGTTTVVGTLMDLRTGAAVAVASTLNGQAPAGADVISRISTAMAGRAARTELHQAIVRTVNALLADLRAEAGVPVDRIYEIVAVGNATMLALLLDVDPEPIATTPFIPPFRAPQEVPARALGLAIHPQGRLTTLPMIGAYVGADLVGGILASGLARDDRVRLLVDVGTNGEIVLGSSQRVLATAAPAGPAFEGASIRHGMRAADGAIEGVTLGSTVDLRVIGGKVRPRGICGSGLVDAVAQLRLAGLLDASGRLRAPADVPGHPLADHLVEQDGIRGFRLVDDIVLTQRDIRELQFGKGSIAAGIRVLMDQLGVGPDQLDEILLAGSFGSYINPDSARIIGLVPWVPVDRILAVGNAAGEGAKMSLLSFREREVAFELPAVVEYIELSGREEFNDIFIAVLGFPDLVAVG